MTLARKIPTVVEFTSRWKVQIYTFLMLYIFYIRYSSKLAIDVSNVQDNTCHLVDKSVAEQQNSLVADLGTTSYTLLPLR